MNASRDARARERSAGDPAAAQGDETQVGLLTIRQVASFLAISPRTVRRLVSSRQLRCVRLGRALRFDPADVFRFVAGRRE